MLRITTLGAYVTLTDTCVVYSVASIPLGDSPRWIPGIQDTTMRLLLIDFTLPVESVVSANALLRGIDKAARQVGPMG